MLLAGGDERTNRVSIVVTEEISDAVRLMRWQGRIFMA